jgi:hypothetical protein
MVAQGGWTRRTVFCPRATRVAFGRSTPQWYAQEYNDYEEQVWQQVGGLY